MSDIAITVVYLFTGLLCAGAAAIWMVRDGSDNAFGMVLIGGLIIVWPAALIFGAFWLIGELLALAVRRLS